MHCLHLTGSNPTGQPGPRCLLGGDPPKTAWHNEWRVTLEEQDLLITCPGTYLARWGCAGFIGNVNPFSVTAASTS